MIKKKRIGALVVGAMIMGMSSTVFAQETKAVPTVGTGRQTEPATVSITKDFEMAEGLSIPNVTFHFTATKVTQDAPNASITAIQYSDTDPKGNANNGKYTISKNSAITFGTFPHAGEYVYTVKETEETVEGVSYSAEQYTLRVEVANGQNGLFVKSIIAEKGMSNGTAGNKVDKILFVNTYRKNTSLVIAHRTTGELADKTKKFEFIISFEKSATENTLNDFTGTLTRKDNTTEQITCSNGRAAFALADGDTLVFSNLPAGTKYKVTETGVKDGYIAHVKVTDNGKQGAVVDGSDEQDLSSSANGNYIGENLNKVEFENTYKEVPITGIIMDNLPFILLTGIVVLAFGILVIIKRRRISGR